MKSTIADRFTDKIDVDIETECFNWTGCKNKGYAHFWNGHKMVKAHRFAFEAFHGPIPDKYEINHKCRNKSCVNVKHLELLTREEHLIKDRDIFSSIGKRTGRRNALNSRKSNLPEGLRYSNRQRAVQTQILCPALRKSVYLGSRSPATKENIAELSQLYQIARELKVFTGRVDKGTALKRFGSEG